MSHFSRLKTQILEKDFLLQALQDLGYTVEEGPLEVQGFGGKVTPVEVRASKQHSYDIGFRKKGDHYEIVADWWGVTGTNQKDFRNQLMQRYAYRVTLAKLEAQGFTLVNEEAGEKGQVRLVLRRTG